LFCLDTHKRMNANHIHREFSVSREFYSILFVKIIWIDIAGLYWIAWIFRRCFRHGWRGRYNANDRGADATSTINPFAKRWHSWFRNGQQYADAAAVDATAPTANAGHAAEQQSNVVTDADVTDNVREFSQRYWNRWVVIREISRVRIIISHTNQTKSVWDYLSCATNICSNVRHI